MESIICKCFWKNANILIEKEISYVPDDLKLSSDDSSHSDNE